MAYDAYGSDDALTLRELPDPKVGPGEVRIRVRRAGVNPVDWKVMSGGLDGLMDAVFPVVPGWDVAGTVESVGFDTPEFEVGDEVVAYARKDVVHGGTFAELVTMSVRGVARKSAALSWDEAGGLPLTGLTALQTLERYKNRLDEVSSALSELEVEDIVSLRDVVVLLQRTEMLMRIAEEIDEYIVELGADGRLVRLQLEEVLGGIGDERRMVMRDYFNEADDWPLAEAMATLAELDTDELLDLKAVAAVLHLPQGTGDLDLGLQPRGYRLLSRIPRIPEPIVDHIVDHFGTLSKIMRATIDDLDDVEGVGDTRAKTIKEGLSKLAESSILDRYS